MATAPAQPDRPLLRTMEGDVEAVLLADVSVNAWYRKKTNMGVDDDELPEVLVRVSADPPAPVGNHGLGLSGRPGPAGLGTTGNAGLRRTGRIMATGLVDQESEQDTESGIGTEGHIVRLAEGDQFIVPGWAVGEPDLTTVSLLVKGDVRPGPGSWTAKVVW